MAAVIDLVCDQGATFTREFVWTDADDGPIDITGYSARMQVRHAYADRDPGEPLGEVTDTEPDPQDEDADSSIITLGDESGVVTIMLSAQFTQAIPSGVHVYDVELVSDDDVTIRLVEGLFTVAPEVTRE